MKHFSLIFIFAFFCTVSFAQGNQATSDPEAKKILDKVSARFKTFNTVVAGFTLKVEDNNGKVQGLKKGQVSMKGEKYKVSVNGQEIFCDGKKIWTYDKAANEVTITQLDKTGNGITPQKLFTNFYDKDFLYKLNGEKKQAGKTLQEIELTPVDKTRNFFKVYLLIDKSNQTIYSTRVLDKSGNIYTYTVNTLKSKLPISDALFVFDKTKYPGVEEIDLQ